MQREEVQYASLSEGLHFHRAHHYADFFWPSCLAAAEQSPFKVRQPIADKPYGMPLAFLVELHADQGSLYVLALTTGKGAFELVMHSRQSEAGNSKLEIWIISNQSAHSYQTRHEKQTKA